MTTEERDTNGVNDRQDKEWQETVLSILGGSSAQEPLKVKKLRKQVLLSLQQDESSKVAKKTFKRTVQRLEKEGTLVLDADGTVKLSKKRKHKEDKKSKKKKKKKSKDIPNEDKGDDDKGKQNHVETDEAHENNYTAKESHSQQPHDDSNNGKKDKNTPCKGNPQGVTRLFLGNLPFAVDETSLEAFIPGLTHVKWITDKETGRFYGSAFVEMSTSQAAADAVAIAGSQLMGRPIKINFAPARPGDPWPPHQKVVLGGGAGGVGGNKQTTGGQAGGSGVKSMSAKPENCVKLFIGNLSYDIDDEGISKFFANVDAEVKAVRWLHHKDTGDFKGV